MSALAVLPLLVLAPAASHQAGGHSLHPSAHQGSVGLREAGGLLHSGGPGYRARFDARGLELTPAFGRRVAASQALILVLESIERGGTPVAGAAAPVAPRRAGSTAVYARGGGVEELYELRRLGMGGSRSGVMAS